MRIVIDLQGAQSYSRLRGIGRYSLSLAHAIAKNAKDHEVLVVLNGVLGESIESIRAYLEGVLPLENIKVWDGYYPASCHTKANRFRKNANELLREAFIDALEPDIVLITSIVEGWADDVAVSINRLFARPTAAIFYDAIPMISPEKYIYPEGKIFEEYYYERVNNYKKAALLFGISDSSCKEAIEYLDIDPSKLINIQAAVDPMFVPISIDKEAVSALKQKFGIKNRFLLYSGASDERKNHKKLIEAFAKLPDRLKQEYQLVIAGGMPTERYLEFHKFASKCGLSKESVLFTRIVSDDELIALYNLCDLYVFPSWHEGFGLPALEAMACGAAVIGSNNTSIPEVIGREDALFDPFDAQSIAEKIKEVLENEPFRQELIAHGLRQAQNFSWDKSALAVIKAFEDFFAMNSEKNSALTPREYQCKLIDSVRAIEEKHNEKDLMNLARCISSNHRLEEKKQLFIDISELIKADAKSGIQRVVRSILAELTANPPEGYSVEPVYAVAERLGYHYAKELLTARAKGEETPLLDRSRIDVRAGDIFLGLDLAPGVWPKQTLYYQVLKEHGVHLYFVVYDILLLRHPEWWPIEASIAFEKLIREISSVADGMLCISDAVADDLREWLSTHTSLRLPRIESFHLGADIASSAPSKGRPENAKNITEQLQARPTFLMVGTLEPRKGHLQTLEAFEKLWESGHDINLVIIGKQGWMVDELITKLQSHPKSMHNLFWLSGASDEYLEEIYSLSSSLILASQGEGFGLPLIEAAQHKLPIISRDLPVLKEVAGEYAYYFKDSNSPKVIVEAIEDWLKLFEKGEHICSTEMPWLTWKQSASQLLGLLRIGSN